MQSAIDNGAQITRIEDDEYKEAATSIYHVADVCFDYFEHLISIGDVDPLVQQTHGSTSGLENKDMLRDVKGIHNSFAFWVDYTGALAPAGASLDDRLQDHVEIKEMVLELLEMIERNLYRLDKRCDENSTFFDEESQKRLAAVDSALDRLNILARAIRTASIQNQERDLINFTSEEDKNFHKMILLYIKREYKDTGSSLREYMGACIAAQRRALMLKSRHANKMKASRTIRSSPTQQTEQQSKFPQEPKDTNSLPSKDKLRKPLLVTGSKATQASKMDKEVFLRDLPGRQSQRTFSTRSSGSLRKEDSMEDRYPDMPRTKSGEKHVQCPYCLAPLKVAELETKGGREYWRRHVDQDLHPYICLFPRCKSSSFTHQSEWSNHMTDCHSKEWPRKVHCTIWYCDLGHETPIEFDNEADWKTHMRKLSLHSSRSKPPTDAQLDVLVSRKQQLALRDPFVCPFCEIKPDTIAVLGDRGNTADMEKLLTRHIASHITSLLLKALPDFDCEATDTSKISIDLEDSPQNRLRNSDSLPHPVSGAEYVEDISPTFDDYDNEDEYRSQSLRRTPTVPIEQEYLVPQSEHDETLAGRTEVDRFFALVPDKEVSFSWESILPESWRWDKVHYSMPTIKDDNILKSLWLQNVLAEILSQGPSERLKRVLRASFVTYAYNKNKRFIPRRQLQIKCDLKAVAKELRRVFPGSDPITWVERAWLICHGKTQNSSALSRPSFKIFAILVLVDEVRLINFFQEHALCDDDLPFRCTSDFGKMWPNNKKEEDHIQFPDGVDDEFIEAFAREQWSVLVPSFESPRSSSLRCNFYEFDDKTILPIISVSKNKHVGGFGVVESVQLHEDHHEFGHSHFALKTIHSMMRFDLKKALFEQELKAFQQAKPGSHLINICAAFKKGENYCFLFPWADGGPLNHLWTKDPQTIVSKKQVKWPEFSQWICRQCHGIIRDLRAIHDPHDTSQPTEEADEDELYGIHSDIKPDNILHFTDDGTPLGILKVSDLGLMKFHRLISRTVPSKSMGAAYQTYRSPEHDTGMMRSRKVDIWAFGCLFAEFITWAIAGQGGIDHFKNMRIKEDKDFPDPNKGEWSEDHFFTMRTGQPKQKGSVAKWFTDLTGGFGETTFFPEFLSFIQNSMLHPNRNTRVDAKEVEQFLERCLKNDVNSSYWDFDGRLAAQYVLSRSSTESSSWSQDSVAL